MLVLETLAAHPEGLPILALAQEVRLPPSTVHRILCAMRQGGYVEQDRRTRLYSLGLKTVRVAARMLDGLDLRRVSSSHLHSLVELTSLNSLLTIYDRVSREAICIDTVGGGGQIKYFVGLGKTLALHCAATGKAVAAFLPPVERDRLFLDRQLEAYTAHTCTNVALIEKEWATIRRQGYAVCDEELELGVAAIGAPVWDASGRVIGSVGVLGVRQALLGKDMVKTARLVMSAGAEIAHTLGGRDPLWLTEG